MSYNHNRSHIVILYSSFLLIVFFILIWPQHSYGKEFVIKGDHNYAPFEYLNEKNEPEGFNIEIIQAIAREMGMQIRIELGPWDQVRSELETGKIDALMGMYNTPERDRLIDFSIPHFIASYAVFVRKDSKIKSIEDVKGKTIIVQEGDLGHDFIVSKGITRRILLTTNIHDVLELLSSGSGDCAIVSRLQGLIIKKEQNIKHIMAVGSPIIQSKYCLAVTEGNSSLLAKLNEGLSILKISGEYDRIYEKWYGVTAKGFPEWIKSVFKAVSVLLLFLALIIFVSRVQVKRKTQELKLKNMAIQESEARLRTLKDFSDHLINSMPGIFFLYQYEDEQFLLKKWNIHHESILGFSTNELQDATMQSFFREKDINDLNAMLAQLIEQASIKTELNLLTKGNALIPLILQAEMFKQEDNTFIIGTGIEIFEQKRIEKENRELEKRLHQTQKMEAIGTLAGGIAHDFNNILFPILGHTEMLLDDVPEDGPFRDSLNEIYTSSLRARDLVRQILTFSRQEKNELKLIKMQPIITEALKLIRSTIPTTISIREDLNPDCGAVKADPTQIHQIAMNLATNAFHAMEETGGELKVNLKEIELGEYDLINPDMTPGLYVCLTIADTGKGINQDILNKIFDPFFTTKERGKGSGLGLSVVHGIVKSMSGEIQVYSEPGKGTEFHVYLPVVKNVFEKQAFQTNEPILGGSERILLVDDEEGILTMEKLVLERLGYRVSSRTSSVEALEAFRNSPDKFDLVITDMAMPNMSGEKLSGELVKIRSDIPVLLCTGFSETMSEEKATSIGIKGFLLKPIVMKDLAQKIREVLG